VSGTPVASPDLLDALVGLVGLVELIIPTLEGSQKSAVVYNHRLIAARKAIASATICAAAPDLLTACQIALVHLRERGSFVDMPDRPGDVEYVRTQLRAAIAKAGVVS
jgi:hypothetical protein